MYKIIDIIQKKRDGQALSSEEIDFFIKGYTRGGIPDYQASALAMAIYFRGMNAEETAHLALAMAASGDTMDLSAIGGIKVDKHSTGGVGDKTTLTAIPIVAAAGVPVAKMSGRGLGHTGGTIDKFESITGFRVQLSAAEFIAQVQNIKLAVIAQSGNLVPADKKLYALRDVTATVDSVPLIASSVMSKKLAAGANAILLDVKVGDGAFMKNLEEAVVLARTMVDIGSRAGRQVAAVLSTMDQPLGYAVGNSLEVKEAVDLLADHGPSDLRELSIFIAGYMIYLGGKALTPDAGFKLAANLLTSGAALDRFRAMIVAQGGGWPANSLPDLPTAPVTQLVIASEAGFIQHIDTEKLGRTAMLLGAGREKIGDAIDYSAGILLNKKPGDWVETGEVLAVMHTATKERAAEVQPRAAALFHISPQPVVKGPLILGVISSQGEEFF
ncbi:MAG: pyrimidine-nucleoside phosphorylase [Methylocystaceae bacterium]